ncbi:MAG: hypothetical protein Q8P67_07150, partial [archaeon]|nr:hypothetical protein [archaeon]
MTHIKSGTSEAELDRIIHKHPEFVTGTDGYGWTPLHYAVLTQKFNTARTLIKKGADSMFLPPLNFQQQNSPSLSLSLSLS